MKTKTIFYLRALAILILFAGLFTPFTRAAGQDGVDLEETAASPTWQQANTSGFGDPVNRGITALEEFQGYLYAGASNWDSGGSIWRSADGFTWGPASEMGFGGPDAAANHAIIDLFKFKNKLYVGVGWDTADAPVGTLGKIWRTTDGVTWEQVVGDGFGSPENNSVTAFFMFGNMLYAGVGNEVTGVQIWRSATGDLGSWAPVVTDGFGYPANRQVTGFFKFKGWLYAAIESNVEFGPAQVWRTKDGLTWAAVTTDGFGDLGNYSTGGFAQFKNFLYLGTRNDATGGQLWRSKNGLTWTRVVGDGFGDITNSKIESLWLYKSKLYAVTQNEVTGMEVWWSKNGTKWQPVSADGFGDSMNTATLWNNATAFFKSQPFVGTWNAAEGGEIWNMRIGKGKKK